jgi:N-acyl-D-amino-acid deacylase
MFCARNSANFRTGSYRHGKIAKGNFADIAVIDLQNFTDRSTYTDRGKYSEGVMYLLVNGVLSIDSGKLTKKRGVGH